MSTRKRGEIQIWNRFASLNYEEKKWAESWDSKIKRSFRQPDT